MNPAGRLLPFLIGNLCLSNGIYLVVSFNFYVLRDGDGDFTLRDSIENPT